MGSVGTIPDELYLLLRMLVITLVAALRLAVTSGRLVVGSEAELYLETGQLDTERVLALATLHNSSRHPYRWGCGMVCDITLQH